MWIGTTDNPAHGNLTSHKHPGKAIYDRLAEKVLKSSYAAHD